jgi:hypothetical protein
LVGDARVQLADVAMAVHLDGEHFVTAIEDGMLVTRDGDAPALAVFDSDMESWRIAVLELTPRLLKRADASISSLRVVERLGHLKLDGLHDCPGVLNVVYEDDAGDEASVRITIAGGSSREARIQANDGELWRLLDGGGRLSQLVTSRVRVSGDIGYVVELARLLEL